MKFATHRLMLFSVGIDIFSDIYSLIKPAVHKIFIK